MRFSKLRHLSRLFLQISVLLITVLIFTGCAEDNGGDDNLITANDHIVAGWDDFNANDYMQALSEFETAIQMDAQLADARNGAGWCAGRLSGKLNEAKTHFETATSLDTTLHDAKGGYIFTIYQLGEYDNSLTKSTELLSRLPGWRFLHDQEVNYVDIRLLMAFCHYHKGNYSAAMDIVTSYNYFNPDFAADLTNANGRRELLEELERLGVIHG